MLVNLGCIVEGDGERVAVPKLLHRIAKQVAPESQLNMRSLFKADRGKLVRPGELERTIEVVVRSLAPPRGVFIVIDADDDCPAQLGPQLLQRAVQARMDVPMAVVLANREYEAWFLAAIESLAGKCGLPDAVPSFPQPEAIRGAKERLSSLMGRNRSYSPTVDQVTLTSHFDMEAARQQSPSFDKCWREIERLLTAVRGD